MNYFKNFIASFTLLFLLTIVGHTQYYVTFTDGEKWDASGFIEECEQSMMDNEMNEALEANDFCKCMVNKIAENFTGQQFTEIAVNYTDGLNDDNYWEKASEFYSNPKIMKFTEECFLLYLNNESDQKITITSESQKKALAQQMKIGLFEQDGAEELEKYLDVDKYCECMVEELTKEFTIQEIANLDPENVKVINIQTKCALKSRLPE